MAGMTPSVHLFAGEQQRALRDGEHSGSDDAAAVAVPQPTRVLARIRAGLLEVHPQKANVSQADLYSKICDIQKRNFKPCTSTGTCSYGIATGMWSDAAQAQFSAWLVRAPTRSSRLFAWTGQEQLSVEAEQGERWTKPPTPLGVLSRIADGQIHVHHASGRGNAAQIAMQINLIQRRCGGPPYEYKHGS